MEDLQAADPRTIGPYRTLSRIGTGGMGVVFLVVDESGSRFALKLLRPEFADDAGFRQRFRREVEAAQRVGGVYNARYLDADLDSSHPYLVTEYIEGGSLLDFVTEHGPLVGDQLIGLAVGLAEALVAMNAAGVVHRDLKPSNVLMAPNGPKVVDFGISLATDGTNLTQTGGVIGSPGWMAPEQALGRPTTAAVDVFSWGARIAFAATGRSPFGAGRPEAVLFRVVHEAADLEGVDQRLRPLVEQALTKDPARRPTADSLLLETVRISARGAALSGRPESMATQFLDHTWHQDPPLPVSEAQPRKRVRSGWILAAALILLAGAGGLGIGYLSHSSSKADSGQSGRSASHVAQTTTTATAPAAATTTTPTVAPTTTAPSTPSDINGVFNFDAASQTVGQLGYNVVSSPNSQEVAPGALNALIGQCATSGTGYCKHAFFFVGSKYIGTDTSAIDIAVELLWQTGDTVALSYPLYAPSDPNCCPTSGSRLVRFQWVGSSLTPLDPLPSNPNSTTGQ